MIDGLYDNYWIFKNEKYLVNKKQWLCAALPLYWIFFFIKIPQELLSCEQSALENRFIHQEVLHPYPDLYIF